MQARTRYAARRRLSAATRCSADVPYDHPPPKRYPPTTHVLRPLPLTSETYEGTARQARHPRRTACPLSAHGRGWWCGARAMGSHVHRASIGITGCHRPLRRQCLDLSDRASGSQDLLANLTQLRDVPTRSPHPARPRGSRSAAGVAAASTIIRWSFPPTSRTAIRGSEAVAGRSNASDAPSTSVEKATSRSRSAVDRVRWLIPRRSGAFGLLSSRRWPQCADFVRPGCAMSQAPVRR